MATVFERVKKIVVEQLGVSEEEVIQTASFAENLNADSLDLVELVLAFEEEFGSDSDPLEISDEDTETLLTVKDVVDYIKERGFEDADK